MALMQQPQFEVLNTCIYRTAPPSPSGGCSPNNLQFYSAPSSPFEGEEGDGDLGSSFDDFEFDTSKRFGSLMESEMRENLERPMEEKQEQEKPKRERGDSLPTMAFADELFANGLVMPLKPPPRLQSWNGQRCLIHDSIPSSPARSPTSTFKNPFIWRPVWNDDFDPFKVALQEVNEEKRGRSSSAGSLHRRTRSHSPFRDGNSEWCNDSERWNQEGRHLEKVQNSESYFKMPNELKGSPYARWVIDQKKQVEQLSPKGRKMLKGLTFVTRVWPVKNDHEGPNKKRNFGKKSGDQDEGSDAVWERKMKKIKGILHRYASIRSEHSEEKTRNQSSTTWGSSYLKKLSFTMKGNASEDGKKRVGTEVPKVAVVEYKRKKPTLALCFYGIESPRDMK